MSMLQGKGAVMQRIQVGLTGLVVVLLFVSLANMLLDSAAETELAGAPAGPTLVGAGDVKSPGEPLAELGAAPVVEADPETENTANGNRQRNGAATKNPRATKPQ